MDKFDFSIRDTNYGGYQLFRIYSPQGEYCRYADVQQELQKLRQALQFYADEDAKDVEAGILKSTLDRPATAALKSS